MTVNNIIDGELSFEQSHELFGTAFTKGFPWEVLKVFSGPPTVLFSWRHWGHLEGKFQGLLLLKIPVCRLSSEIRQNSFLYRTPGPRGTG